MGVDYYSCNYCGETFPDCGDYTYCECGNSWCSDECATEEGYVKEYCKLGYDVEDNEEEDCCHECYGCSFHVETSCNYCRNEDYSNETLLDYALDLLGISRSNLIERYNQYTGKEVK